MVRRNPSAQMRDPVRCPRRARPCAARPVRHGLASWHRCQEPSCACGAASVAQRPAQLAARRRLAVRRAAAGGERGWRGVGARARSDSASKSGPQNNKTETKHCNRKDAAQHDVAGLLWLLSIPLLLSSCVDWDATRQLRRSATTDIIKLRLLHGPRQGGLLLPTSLTRIRFAITPVAHWHDHTRALPPHCPMLDWPSRP